MTKNLIVKNKNSNTSSDKQPFDFLTSLNDWLESVPLRTINAFENMIGDGEKAVQSKVDRICAWLAWKVNIAIEGMRQRLLKALYNTYKNTVVGKVMQIMNVIQNFVKNPLEAIGSFASAIFAPYGAVISWYQTLIKEVPRLAKNLSNVASALPPTPPNPHINFNAFKIKVKTISISDVTSNPDNLPPPEVMFPEPEKPFSTDTFNDVFMNVSAKLKTNRLIYKLNEKDKQALLFSSDPGSINSTSNLV